MLSVAISVEMAPIIRLPGFSCSASIRESLGQVVSALRYSPTKTLAIEPSELRIRQAPPTVTVTSDPGNGMTTLSGGAIAGIVIGSIVGFLLLLWIIRSCMNLGAPPQERESWVRVLGYRDLDNTLIESQYHDVEPKRHRSRSTHGHHHHHHHRRSHPEVVTVQSTPVVIRDERRRSRNYDVRTSRSPRRPDEVYVHDANGRARGSGKYYSSY